MLIPSSPETSIFIDAPLADVWRSLSDIGSYNRWNSRTRFDDANGIVEQGQRLTMVVRLFGFWLKVPVVIEYASEAKGLRWVGGISGLYRGSHYFHLQAVGNRTRLVQGEDFYGAIVPVLFPLIKRELNRLYNGMNQELKVKCEQAKRET